MPNNYNIFLSIVLRSPRIKIYDYEKRYTDLLPKISKVNPTAQILFAEKAITDSDVAYFQEQLNLFKKNFILRRRRK